MSTPEVQGKFLSAPSDIGVTAVGFSGGQGKKGVDSAPTALIESGLLKSLQESLCYRIHHDNVLHTYKDIIPADDPMIDGMKNPMSPGLSGSA